MRILIIGGTVFLGRALVDAALERGHDVTLFNRGQHNPELYPEVEKLRGDRDGALDALRGRRWDAVVDTCGYVPRVVKQSAELLAGNAANYTFISSISAFPDLTVEGVSEELPKGTLEDETVEEITNETYGPLKVLCEEAVQAAFPDGALIIRPGLIVGPHDPTDRFTYWPRRVSQGGDVLAPGNPAIPVQSIDARDLAQWTVRMIEERQTGDYNATGPDYRLTFGDVLETSKAVSGSDARFVWVDEQFLLDEGVGPWMELPLWAPGMPGINTADCRKAFAAGLTFRPLADTIRDTLAWDAARPVDSEYRAGMAREREAELLAKWRATAR